jgi:transposase
MRPPTAQFAFVDALPLVNHFLGRLRVETFLDSYLPRASRRPKVSSTRTLLVLLRNIVLSREPLYGVGAWARRFDGSLLGLSSLERAALNDDRVGRALDRLFDADRSSLVLSVVVRAVREFGLRLDRFHNDSTTVSFQGRYRLADGRPRRGKPTLRITFGRNKDHRPDLRQLLWSLTASADGAVPVHYQALDGNTTDDQTHLTTWKVLRGLAGRSDFLYVADSKLCTRPNMTQIVAQGGRFLTVLPATRKEERRFHDWIQIHEVPWTEVLRRPLGKKRAPDVFRAYEDPAGSQEGYRIVWYHSTEKEKRDAQERDDKLDRTIRKLQDLQTRLASPRCRLRTRTKVDLEIEEILEELGMDRYLAVEVQRKENKQFRQEKRGRPGPNTRYRPKIRVRFELSWTFKQDVLTYDIKTDGIFPLITSDRKLTLRRILEIYKRGQPTIEQRHHTLKSTLDVAPQFLKSVSRIEAFLCMYFLALLVNALVEREMRQAMKSRRLKEVPIYHEGRYCKHPTTEQILKAFDDLVVQRISGPGPARHVSQPTLTRLQKRILRLLRVPARVYRIGSA